MFESFFIKDISLLLPDTSLNFSSAVFNIFEAPTKVKSEESNKLV